jgi:dTMP kinase
MMFRKGKFITFEGIDGAGKSSHIDAVATCLRETGITVVCTREPGGTLVGEQIRQLFLNHSMRPLTEALLVFAARREHLETVVWPELDAGHWVLCDRFTDATFAYQGGGRELGRAPLDALVDIVHADFAPDLTLLFDLSQDSAQARMSSRSALDRIEREKADFHERVRAAYLARASAEPSRIAVFDSSQPKDVVRDRVIERVKALVHNSGSVKP